MRREVEARVRACWEMVLVEDVEVEVVEVVAVDGLVGVPEVAAGVVVEDEDAEEAEESANNRLKYVLLLSSTG